jgi:hypothetical protein
MTHPQAQVIVLSNPERPGRERSDHANLDPRRRAVHPRGPATRESDKPRAATSHRER